jgi:hypothetical protein
MSKPKIYNRRTIEPGLPMSASDMRYGLNESLAGPSRRRNGYSITGVPFKHRAATWILEASAQTMADIMPYMPGAKDGPRSQYKRLSRCERMVWAAIVWRYDVRRQCAPLSYEHLADAAANIFKKSGDPINPPLGRRTVARAVAYLERIGFIQIRSGRGGRQDRRNLPNHYVPNLWMFVNAETGNFKSPQGMTRNGWRNTAETFRARIKCDENNRSISLDWVATA